MRRSWNTRLSPTSSPSPKVGVMATNQTSEPIVPHWKPFQGCLSLDAPTDYKEVSGSCVTQQQQATAAFPLFQKIPKELRLKIWALAVPGPRTVTLTMVGSPKTDISVKSTSCVPAMLHVNLEAREVALKKYSLVEGSIEGLKPIYFDFDMDTLVLNHESIMARLPNTEMAQVLEDSNCFQSRLKYLILGTFSILSPLSSFISLEAITVSSYDYGNDSLNVTMSDRCLDYLDAWKPRSTAGKRLQITLRSELDIEIQTHIHRVRRMSKSGGSTTMVRRSEGLAWEIVWDFRRGVQIFLFNVPFFFMTWERQGLT
ncbi:hypothetical protein VTL71DRAFT_10305 [Oculimacula yallundae]|uniref:2EXR domain-containing protein n=1 Tax=Oculimacula yallundae TaxID=86028 RepID=A0ABR4CU75_9HELO